MNNISFGQYFPGNSLIHRLDARTKLLITLELIVIVFVVKTYIGYIATASLIALGIILSRIPVKFVLKSIKAIWFILAFTFVLNVFFMKGDTVLWHWWKISITVEGIINAVKISVRLILLMVSTSLMTLTTSPMEITAAIESLLKPLAKIGVPVHELALMMSIALRFIPTLIEETDKIMKAQTARGASFDTGGLLAKAKGLVPILVPLFVSAFKRADELALAMESRCYNGGAHRTKYKIMKLGLIDLFTAAAAALLIVVAAFGL